MDRLLQLDFKQVHSIAQQVSVLLSLGLVVESLFNSQSHYPLQLNIDTIILQEEQIKVNLFKSKVLILE